MHAGEALWQLYASLTAISTRAKDNTVSNLLLKAEECCQIIGDHIQVGAPPPDQRVLRAEALVESLKSSAQDEEKFKTITDGEAREAFDIATGILEDLESLPDKADEFVESVGEKVASIREYIEKFNRVTAPQMKSLNNMRGGVDKWMH